ncbi:MAG: glycosyltransferase [Lachnospiraceae bacterium]|nr:glycosyltransferase [Lachnospiraceae bacterium]
MSSQETNGSEPGRNEIIREFTQAMDAMSRSGGKIYYFVADPDAEEPLWGQVLYSFEQMFKKNCSELLIIEMPKKYSERQDYGAINALIDRFASECYGIIKLVNAVEEPPKVFYHAGIYLAGNRDDDDPYIAKAAQNGMIVEDANLLCADYRELPFLTASGKRKPLVSICIPTHNRAAILVKTLDSIICQPEFGQGLVEIVISDNCSTDDTELVGRYYDQKYEGINYYRNKEDITGGNFNLALERATGLLRKLNNDTCVHYPGSLAYMCEMVRRYACTKPVIYFGNVPPNAGDGEYLLLLKQFLMKETFHITWISSFTIWDEDCKGIVGEYIDGEPFWQVRKTMELLEKRGAAAACDRGIMGALVNNKHYSGKLLWDIFHDDFFDIVGKYLSNQEKELIEMDLLFNHFGQIKLIHERNPVDLKLDDDFDEVMEEHYADKPYWADYLRIYGNQ